MRSKRNRKNAEIRRKNKEKQKKKEIEEECDGESH